MSEDGASQRAVFDPALLHYPQAFLVGEPDTVDAAALQEWRQGRSSAIGALLAAISNSRWLSSLVLRGSTSLRSWFGEAAREPGDLDFVVVPSSWDIADPRTDHMLAEIVNSAEQVLRGNGGAVRIDTDAVVSDRIWTYERVPGQRLSVPWHLTSEDVAGWVQLDFVFGEEMPVAPVPIDIDVPGGVVRLNSAGPELSLAWKLVWLIDDIHPQEKDLYDAVLLAENTALTFALLCGVLTQLPEHRSRPVSLQDVRDIRTKRVNLSDSTSDGVPSETDLVERLVNALTPIFVDPATGEPFTRWELTRRWLSDVVSRYRSVLEESDWPSVHRLLAEEAREQGLRPEGILIVVDELMGPEFTLQEAYLSVLSSPAWASRAAAGDFAVATLNRWLPTCGRRGDLVAIPLPAPAWKRRRLFRRRRTEQRRP